MAAILFSRALTALMLGLLLAQPALAQQDNAQPLPDNAQQQQKAPLLPSAAAESVAAMSARYPRGSINSVDVAEQAKVDLARVRSMLAVQFAAAESACYEKFFTNSCIDKAKEEQRGGMAALRPIDLEAGAFLRQDRVAQRDKALEELRIKSEAEAQERLRQQPENEEKAARKATESARREQEGQARQATSAGVPDNRLQRHEEKLQRLRLENAGKEQERAKNIAAYERKQKEAAERQRELAEKKAQKQSKQTGKPAAPVPVQPAEPAKPAGQSAPVR